MRCERCEADIERAAEKLPAPWFDHDQRLIGGSYCEAKLWQILEILWRRRGVYTTRDSFMALLYGHLPDDPPDPKVIDVFICKLRRLLDHTPFAITTAFAVGFQLVDRGLVATGRTAAAAEVELGAVEKGIGLPAPRANRPRVEDIYGLRELNIGESRAVANVSLDTLRNAAATATRRELGEFRAGFDADRKLRIWRVA
jgi:hypothetical protein